MTQGQIKDLLSQQADQLVAGQELPGGGAPVQPAGVDRSAGLNAEERRALSALMLLARRIQAAMAPVEPRPAFAADLKARLVAQRRAQAQPAAGAGRGMLWLAGLAGAVSMAGLGFVSYRVARAGVGRMSAVAASRNAPAGLPKA